jgi:orotate phosphoribosyltransferase
MSEVLTILESVGAIIRESHFVGTSGRHFATYVNKDMLLARTTHGSAVGKLFAEKFAEREIEVVVAPAVAGIGLSIWTAYHLTQLTGTEVLSVFTEKTPENDQVFKRGFDALVHGKRCLILEDLTTTGGSVKKVVQSVWQAGGEVVEVSVMVNRDTQLVTAETLGAPFSALAVLEVPSYSAEDCPLCEAGVSINTTVGHGKAFLDQQAKKKSSLGEVRFVVRADSGLT